MILSLFPSNLTFAFEPEEPDMPFAKYERPSDEAAPATVEETDADAIGGADDDIANDIILDGQSTDNSNESQDTDDAADTADAADAVVEDGAATEAEGADATLGTGGDAGDDGDGDGAGVVAAEFDDDADGDEDGAAGANLVMAPDGADREQGSTFDEGGVQGVHEVWFFVDGKREFMQSVEEGKPAELPREIPDIPPGKGYVSFLGWYVVGSTEPYDFSKPVEGPLNLEAVFSDKYLVQFLDSSKSI
jgi:hypothetical protein